MRWLTLVLAVVTTLVVVGGGYVLHLNSDPYASERTVEVCKAQFAAEFPNASARSWESDVYEDFAKVYAETPAIGFDYGCHLRRRGLTWAIDGDPAVRVDGAGNVIYRPSSAEPLEPGRSGSPNGICVDGSSDC